MRNDYRDLNYLELTSNQIVVNDRDAQLMEVLGNYAKYSYLVKRENSSESEIKQPVANDIFYTFVDEEPGRNKYYEYVSSDNMDKLEKYRVLSEINKFNGLSATIVERIKLNPVTGEEYVLEKILWVDGTKGINNLKKDEISLDNAIDFLMDVKADMAIGLDMLPHQLIDLAKFVGVHVGEIDRAIGASLGEMFLTM